MGRRVEAALARKSVDFARAPFTVIWEATQACDLRCRHCRANAQTERDSRELTTIEGQRLLEEIRELGSPVFVITGGDPLKRPDLFRLIEHATGIGLPVALTPSGTPLLTREAIRHMHDAGARRIALSLDGPSAGKCGACEFRTVCGGSRARAWATTGNPMAADPLCAYEPGGTKFTSV